MSQPKPHWRRTFSRTEDGVRVITMSAMVPCEAAPGGQVRAWMEEAWQLPTSGHSEAVQLKARTCYWITNRNEARASLETCLAEAFAPQPAES